LGSDEIITSAHLSPERVKTPNELRILQTVDFPLPIPPVIPIVKPIENLRYFAKDTARTSRMTTTLI
jgi:hypothetical protein